MAAAKRNNTGHGVLGTHGLYYYSWGCTIVFRRFLSFVVAICFCLLLVPARVSALGPPDLAIAAALVSMAESAGIHFFREGLEASGAPQAMADDLYGLWDDYQDSLSEGIVPFSWTDLLAGVIIDSGRAIFNHDSAIAGQGFIDWLKLRYNLVPGGGYVILDDSASSSGFFVLNSLSDPSIYTYLQPSDLPITFDAPSDITEFFWEGNLNRPYGSYIVSNSSAPVYRLALRIGPNSARCDVLWFSTASFTLSRASSSMNAVTGFSGSTVIGGQTFYYYSAGFSNSSNITSPELSYNIFPRYFQTGNQPLKYELFHAFYHNYTDSPNGSRLVADVGVTIANLIHDLTDEQALSIDVGLPTDATDDEFVERVSGGYVGQTRDIGAFESVATPVPIEGVQELYPQPATDDVEGLGLPALGQALTNVFPFCIPFDVVAIVKSLNAEAVPPRFKIDLVTDSMRSRLKMSSSTDTSFMMDLSDPKFQVLHKLIYWGTSLTFCISLALATKRLSWSSGG